MESAGQVGDALGPSLMGCTCMLVEECIAGVRRRDMAVSAMYGVDEE